MRTRKLSALALAVLCFASSLIWAQSTTSLRGTVADAKGAMVPNAAVTISNAQTGFSRSTKSDGEGVYQLLQLPPATYTISVTAEGFGTLKQGGVELLVSVP